MNVQNGLLDRGGHAQQAVMVELRRGTLEYDTFFKVMLQASVA